MIMSSFIHEINSDDYLPEAITKMGIGFKNVSDRIVLYFGKPYGIEIYSKLGIGTSVKIHIPVVK